MKFTTDEKIEISIKNENENEQKQDGNKKTMLSSLIMQLEDLERLVKSTKNELMKYSNSEKDSENDILNKANLKSLNSKIENLFK